IDDNAGELTMWVDAGAKGEQMFPDHKTDSIAKKR
ncbi:unnamed protein product, partial [marine sediment metagenome]